MSDIIEKYNLTTRQVEIARLRMLGYTNKRRLSEALGISESTLFREMQNTNLQMAIGALSLQLLEQNQSDARTLAQSAIDYLQSVIDSPDIPVDLKLKATKQAFEATVNLDRVKIESEIMAIWKAQNLPQQPTQFDDSDAFFERIE